MIRSRLAFFGLALLVASCAVSASDGAPGDVTASTMEQEVQGVVELQINRSSPLPTPAAGTTCTDTFGPCKVGKCELGPLDHFQNVTTVCCTAGVCTTTHLRLCGC
jgi:hypothetical protein